MFNFIIGFAIISSLSLIGVSFNSGARTLIPSPPDKAEIASFIAHAISETNEATDYFGTITGELKFDDFSHFENAARTLTGYSLVLRTSLTQEQLSLGPDDYFKNRQERIHELMCNQPHNKRMIDAGVTTEVTLKTNDDVDLGTMIVNTRFC